MDVQSLQSLLDAQPFKPFTIATTRTGRYRITSARDVLLTTTALYVGRDPDAAGVPADVAIVPLMQIASIDTSE